MKNIRSLAYLASMAAILGILLAPTTASADDCEGNGKRWTLRAFGAKLDAAGDKFETSSTNPTERSKFAINSGDGLGVELERRFNCPFGLTFGLLTGEFDSMLTFDTDDAWLMAGDDVELQMFTIGANFHLTPRGRADFYVGPFLAIAELDGSEFELGPPAGTVLQDVDGETTFGFGAGLDVPFKNNGPWAFTAGVRYVALAAEGNGFELDIDPLIATAGIAYRWGGTACCAAEAMAPPPAPEPEPMAAPEPAPVAPPPPPPPPPAAPTPPPAPVEERETCHFNTNGARVSNICKAKLDEVALKLKQDPALGALVVGHADSSGNDGINDPLSARRAEAVKGYLVERHGIDGSRIATEGHGSREPEASNDTRDGRAANRRAVVIISLG